jgi:hypothetical protein
VARRSNSRRLNPRCASSENTLVSTTKTEVGNDLSPIIGVREYFPLSGVARVARNLPGAIICRGTGFGSPALIARFAVSSFEAFSEYTVISRINDPYSDLAVRSYLMELFSSVFLRVDVNTSVQN